MKKNSKILKEKFYGKAWTHPYRTYEKIILDHIGPESVVLDAGCGQNAPVLQKLVGLGKYLNGYSLHSRLKAGIYLNI